MAEIVAAACFETIARTGRPADARRRDGLGRRRPAVPPKGVNGRWKGVLAPEDLAEYDARVKAEFSPSLAAWLEHGRLTAGDPETRRGLRGGDLKFSWLDAQPLPFRHRARRWRSCHGLGLKPTGEVVQP